MRRRARGSAPDSLPREPGLLQGPLLGDVARLRPRLDPVDRGVREQVAGQQPLRVRPVTAAACLGHQRGAYLPVVPRRPGRLPPVVHQPEPFAPQHHKEDPGVLSQKAVLFPPPPPVMRVAPSGPLELANALGRLEQVPQEAHVRLVGRPQPHPLRGGIHDHET